MPASHSPGKFKYDAVVVGAGPNGLAAAITLVRAGRSVLVLEARDTIGGGSRTAELTLPGFRHDVCSAVHPMALSSPLFNDLPLAEHGLEYIESPVALAHPFDDEPPALVERSFANTGRSLGQDAEAYRRLLQPYADGWHKLAHDLLGPLPVPPRAPLLMARFGLFAIWPMTWLGRLVFSGRRAPAVLAGMAAHSLLPLEAPVTSAFGMVVNITAHSVGWPIVRGGSQRLVDALASYLRSLGGEIVTGQPVTGLRQLPASRHVLFDLTPRQLVDIAGEALPPSYVRRLQRFRYGMGVFKVDFALDGPIPWREPDVARSATVHLGGSLEEIAASERNNSRGQHNQRPFVLLSQPSLFDPTRAPGNCHTVWAYCHVPHGSNADMSGPIEAQIERFAPGFRDRIVGRSVMNTTAIEAYNANYIGGDINGGVQDWRQLFTRPVARAVPYSTPNPRIYLCSSSTPPGGGVHGMCGYHAARAVLRASR
jgi:phytoene dehydrogenase-like protein